MTSTPVLQFGTSRFLQAHADLFIHEAASEGQSAGPITVVASSGLVQGRARLTALASPDGYPVHIRGMIAGRPVESQARVLSIRRAIDAESGWAELTRVFVEEAQFIISNTTESGFAVPPGLTLDLSEPARAAPQGYPAKLLALLAARHRDGGGPLTVLPTELVARNGDTLHRAVLDLARRSNAPATLFEYANRECIFANSLVDRIVSAALEPAGAIAEPYALWAVEARPDLVLPCRHPAITVVEDLEPVERLKLHILNLGHTVLADLWQSRSMPSDLTVREMLSDEVAGTTLRKLYEDEVLPGFRAKGMETAAEAYLATTLDRFANPFLDHRLSDIAVNHSQKVRKRIVSFLTWSGLPPASSMPGLSALCERNGIAAESNA
jgi:tagaturonate reductase